MIVCSICHRNPAEARVGDGWVGSLGAISGEPYCDPCLTELLDEIREEEEKYEWQLVER